MNLPKLIDLDFTGKRVIVRMDFDTPQGDLTRIESSEETLNHLLTHNVKLILIGHKGRPFDSAQGKPESSLSLRSFVEPLERIVKKEITFVEDLRSFQPNQGEVFLLENLRFDARESFDPAQDAGAEEFSKSLAALGDFYVNEAFAVSHRKHASIVGIPKLLPHAAGFRFVKEIEMLSHVLENPERPLIFIISGIKEDKLAMIENIEGVADKILVAGKLPLLMNGLIRNRNPRLKIADLGADTEDITVRSIEGFEREISSAKTIVLAGVVGKYEDEGHRLGTKRVFTAVANSNAYKVAGGGDTEAAISLLSLADKFDWISVGGGAMLEFLAKRTLPGIEALLSSFAKNHDRKIVDESEKYFASEDFAPTKREEKIPPASDGGAS